MALSEQGQEILERWWQHSQGRAERVPLGALGADQGSLGLKDICDSGLGQVVEGSLELNGAGLEEARAVTRRHLLAERLLVDVLDTRAALVEERACRLEHALQDGLEESICRLLGHPTECPHGTPIPPGACCKEDRRAGGRAISPLSRMGGGEGGKVAYLQGTDPDQVRKLMAMGVLPGKSLSLVQRFPSFVFLCGNSEFAVDETIANAIYVRLEPAGEHKEDQPQPAIGNRRRLRWGRLQDAWPPWRKR